MAKLRPFLVTAVVALTAACGPPKHLPNAAYYMGETYLRRGQLTQAIEAYNVFITDPGTNPDLYLPRAYYMLAFAYYRDGKLEDSLATLDALERRFPENDSVQVWTLRGDVSRALGNRIQAVQEYDEAWRYAGQLDRVRLETRIARTLKDMSVEELSQTEQLVSDPVVHDLAAKQLIASGGSLIAAGDQAAIADEDAALAAMPGAGQPIMRGDERRKALEEERQKRARVVDNETAALDQPRGGTLAVPPAPSAEPLAVEVAPPVPAIQGKVVCLAPLTGPESANGQSVCNSVTSAFGEASERVVTQDAGETSNAARAAWMTAIEDPSVVGAIVWLPRDAAAVVVPMAETAGMPTILLSGSPGSEGRYVREWGPGRSAEVNGLTNYMLNTVRVRRFGVFYPDTAAGNDYLDRFSTAVHNGGGELVGKQFYRTGDLDERPLLETLKKWRKRDVNVDAVFVPDQLANVEDLVTQINRDFPDVIVLGLSSWSGSTANLQAFVASGTDSSAFDAASALYGAVVGGAANTRTAVEDRLRHVGNSTTAASGPATILHLQNGTASAVGG
jgi:tetratricopeptide (TPR) repeat protein